MEPQWSISLHGKSRKIRYHKNMSSESLDELKDKLSRLEAKLKQILDHHKRDLKLAQKLQGYLLPSRSPGVAGISSFARHIPGSETSHDTFDIIISKDQKELYLVAAWTPQYGLSSALLQTLFHLQSLALLQARTDISLNDLYSDIQKSFAEFDPAAHFRLSLVKLDIHTLKMEILLHNAPPLLLRHTNRNQFENPTYLPENLFKEIQTDKAFHYECTLKPGSRFFYVGSAWNKNPDMESFFAPLQIDKLSKDGALQDDLSHLVRYAELHQKNKNPQEDITVVGFEVDQRKIHLA
jgi:hypothetical protein